MRMGKKDTKVLCKLQRLYEGEGLVIVILMFLKITSHSSLLSHQQVGMMMPFSTVFVRIMGDNVCTACVGRSANKH